MTPDGFIHRTTARLRARAELLRQHGAAEAASTCEQVAAELERDFEQWWLAELTVSEASTESGYSPDRLRELVREGRLPDRRPPRSSGEIRIRRADLPRRPRTAAPTPAVDALATQILAGRK